MTLMQRIEDAQGMARLGHFFILLEVLSTCEDYQLLSGVTTPQLADEHSIDRTNRAVDYILPTTPANCRWRKWPNTWG